MTSPLLALFIRSLREDCRSKLTYFSRAGLASVILLFLFGVATASSFGAIAPGLSFFTTVITIDFIFVLLAGVSYFSSAISEEKEEMTLGLLRMTNLNPLSILLGKSTSRLCTAILLFAAQIPFTMLAITLGGISMRQVFAAYVSVGAFLVFVSNLALLASVICRRTSSAAVATGLFLFTFFAIVPIANWIAWLPFKLGLIKSPTGWVTALHAFAEYAWQSSPFSRLDDIFTTGFNEGAFSFQVWSNLILGLACFLLSWASFEKFCGEQRETGPSRRGTARSRGKKSSFSPGRAWARPLAWKDFYFFGGGKLWLLIKFIVYGIPVALARLWPESLGGPVEWNVLGAVMFWLAAVLIQVELAFAVAGIFRIERQNQTLSSLAMLPQGVRKVAYQKLLGIVPSLSAAGFYLLASIPLNAKLIGEIVDEIFSTSYPFQGWAVVYIAFMICQGIFFLHLVANLSLRVKRGGLPLSIALHLLLFVFGSILMSSVVRDHSVVFILLVFTVIATGFLHVNTGQRLEELAAED